MKINNFNFIASLGQGGCGSITLAKCNKDFDFIKRNQLVAIKAISKQHMCTIMREIEVSFIN